MVWILLQICCGSFGSVRFCRLSSSPIKMTNRAFCLSGLSDGFRPLEKHRYHHEEEWPEKEGFAWTGSCFSFQCRNNFGVWSSARKIRDVQVSLICHLDKHCSVISSIRALFSYWGTISGSKVWNRLCWLCAWGKVTLALGDSPGRPLKDSQEETRHRLCVLIQLTHWVWRTW